MNASQRLQGEFIPLSAYECYQTKGGSIIAAILVGAGIAAAGEIIRDWDNFKNGLMGRPEEE